MKCAKSGYTARATRGSTTVSTARRNLLAQRSASSTSAC